MHRSFLILAWLLTEVGDENVFETADDGGGQGVVVLDAQEHGEHLEEGQTIVRSTFSS